MFQSPPTGNDGLVPTYQPNAGNPGGPGVLRSCSQSGPQAELYKQPPGTRNPRKAPFGVAFNTAFNAGLLLASL